MRNRYNFRSHTITGFQVGRLMPWYFAEVTPGDTWQGVSNAIMRLAPLELPLFMQMNIQTHLFYVPYRLLQDEFPEIWTGEDTSTAWPTITYNAAHEFWTYMGVAINVSSTPAMNAFPARAYNHVWNNHFRNPLEQAERTTDKVDTLGQIHFPSNEYYGSIQTEVMQGGATDVTVSVSGTPDWSVVEAREKFAEARYKERRASFGESYEDVLKTEFGISLGDVRLNRAEHIGRGRSVMGISEVVATATSAGENTGEYKGHGITTHRTRLRRSHFKEPGCIIGVGYARPRLQLRHGCPHSMLLQSRDELFQPGLTHDSVEAVSSAEVYFNNATYSNFGYHPRYEHLRKPLDIVTPKANIYDFSAYVDLSSTPTVTFLHQVQDYDHIFQNASDEDLRCYFDNKFTKVSNVPKRKK